MKGKFSLQGFTLIELLIVVALLAMLISASMAGYIISQQRARNARRVSDLKNIQTAEEQYFLDNNSSYPNSASCNPGAAYLPQGLPKDPKPGFTYAVGTCTAAAYSICATMEPNPSTAGNATAAGPPPTFNAAGGQLFCIQNLQ